MTSLTPIESDDLVLHEQVIERGLTTFMEVGTALLAIRDGWLYRRDFGTFEDYCRERWGMSKTHANRLVQSAEVVSNLTPIGVSASETIPVRSPPMPPTAGLVSLEELLPDPDGPPRFCSTSDLERVRQIQARLLRDRPEVCGTEEVLGLTAADLRAREYPTLERLFKHLLGDPNGSGKTGRRPPKPRRNTV